MEQQSLEKKIAQLPDLMKLKLEGYVDALLADFKKSSPDEELITARGYGSLKGEIWIAEDFDKPLEDFNDYI